jgi:hypothetical protein
VSDRSFVRFGGLAGILLAITSWAAVVSYYTVARAGADVIGLQVFQLLYGLIAFWALFGIVAVYWVVRRYGEAWSFFATLIGIGASLGTITSSFYGAAVIREVAARPTLVTPFATPTDPLSVMTFALTGLWFVIANLLLWKAAYPRLLVALGFIAVADLFAGFFAALSGNAVVLTDAGIIAGAVGGPLYWLWLGILLRRRAPLAAPG